MTTISICENKYFQLFFSNGDFISDLRLLPDINTLLNYSTYDFDGCEAKLLTEVVSVGECQCINILLPLLKELEELKRKDMSRKENSLVESMMTRLRESLLQNLCVDSDSTKKMDSLWMVSRESYSGSSCVEEWPELIKSLRVVGNDIHHLCYTNTYIEQQLNTYYEEIIEVRKLAELVTELLNEVTRNDAEFNRLMAVHLSPHTKIVPKMEKKFVKFGNIPRKSKSAEYSVRKMCSSCGLALRQFPAPVRKEKSRRKTGYGKHCKTCGAIEVSPQNSVMKCYTCKKEIIIKGLCSSCDSVNRQLKKDKVSEVSILDKACSTCDVLRKKMICWNERSTCNRCRKELSKGSKEEAFSGQEKHWLVPKVTNYVEESSYCSDCEVTTFSVSDLTQSCLDRNPSIDSLVPLSDSSHFVMSTMRNYSQDYDVSSSISSSGPSECTENEKFLTPVRASLSTLNPLSRDTEETLSADEEFATPREYLSVENTSMTSVESDAELQSPESTLMSLSIDDDNSADEKIIRDAQTTTGSGDYIDANFLPENELEESSDKIKDNARNGCYEMLAVQESTIDEICNRMIKTEKALNDIAAGNCKLENGIITIEEISQQNLQISALVRDIVLEMTAEVENERCVPKDKKPLKTEESEESDVFEEALEELPVRNESHAETHQVVSRQNHCYLCLECGITIQYKILKNCVTCNRRLIEVQNWFLKKSSTPPSTRGHSMSGDELMPAVLSRKNWKVDVKSAFPSGVRFDFSHLPFTSMENRLRCIEKETGLLRRNNEIINLFIDDLRTKLQDELKRVQRGSVGYGETCVTSGTAVVGLDFSFYQMRRHITERKEVCGDAGKVVEEIKQEVCQNSRTFMEMKFEEVFKKEQQRAVELEIFEQKLEIEGFIIKEKEDFFTCSNSSLSIDNLNDAVTLPGAMSRRFASETFQTVKAESENDELVISIEIEVDREPRGNEKKAVFCEYEANLQKSTSKNLLYGRMREYESVLPTIRLHPTWSKNRSWATALSYNDGSSMLEKNRWSFGEVWGKNHSDGEFNSEEPYFIDISKDDFVEIKPPKLFYGSSEEELESCGGDFGVEKQRKTFSSVTAVRMPFAMFPITEISLSETPFVVLNTVKHETCKKRESSRIPLLQLSQSCTSGVVFPQLEAVSSLGATDSPGGLPSECSLEEFVEAKSQFSISDTSFNYPEKGWDDCSHDTTSWKLSGRKNLGTLLRFAPMNMTARSAAGIILEDRSTPTLVMEDTKPAVVSVSVKESELVPAEELTEALNLIHEIEHDVADVELHKAIAILPRLESILREHVQGKMKLLKKKSSTMTNSSLEVFMSTLNFLADKVEVSGQHETEDISDKGSDERLGKMLQLLTSLEDAVRHMNASENSNECQDSSAGHIYDLLKSLSSRIKGFKAEPDVSDIEKTLKLTSELDVAVRKYSSSRQNDSKVSLGMLQFKTPKCFSETDEYVIVADKLKSVKNKIFDLIKCEAREREERVERVFDRIDRLEKENTEVMRFLDTLLDKTLRRVEELDEVRSTVLVMKNTIDELLSNIKIKQLLSLETRKEKKLQSRMLKVGRTPALPSIKEVSSDNKSNESEEEDTLSGIITALDNLKSKAREKKKKYDEIFGGETDSAARSLIVQEKTSSSTRVALGNSQITEFHRIGPNAYYMTWSKPEFDNEDDSTILGYEIWANGRINQRVRNPERLKAVLYSVNSAGGNLRIQLYAVTEGGGRHFLADLIHPQDEG